MKILNLYAGIGGNRKLWGDEHEVTAVELNPEIAAIYQEFFPKDKVIIRDAHQYLLEHYKEFDFIWSSPPCQSHSRQRKMGVEVGQNKPKFPDLKLYEEILFLQGFCKAKWIVENVIGYYEPLVKAKKIQRHLIWSNFFVDE
jgi:DNA (cytosine-5)-methyltransferase 1